MCLVPGLAIHTWLLCAFNKANGVISCLVLVVCGHMHVDFPAWANNDIVTACMIL